MSGLLPARGLLVAIGAVLILAGEALGGSVGRVEVRVTDHRAGIADFAAFWVAFDEVSLHRKGYPRGSGWVAVVLDARLVDIVPLKDGRSAPIGGASVEAGRYDAVRVGLGSARGDLWRGGRADVILVRSAVAVDLDLEPGTTQVVLIDLYVEDQSEHQPRRYGLKVRAVRVAVPARSEAIAPHMGRHRPAPVAPEHRFFHPPRSK